MFRPSEPKFPWLHGGVRSKTRRPGYESAAEISAARLVCSQAESAKLGRDGAARPPDQLRARARRPPVRDRAQDRARHREAVEIARIFLHQRIAVAVRPARRSGGAE